MSDIPIPDEVLLEILSRLPVTPLLRFRCVCKPWKCLIDSDQFIKDHLNQSRKSNSNLNIIIIKQGNLYSADFDHLFTETNNNTNPGTFQEFLHQLKTTLDTDISGSCDGLLVLSIGEDENILWNLSTRRFHNIPVTEMEYYNSVWQSIVYGFGYDVVSDDYKLIRLIHPYGMDNEELGEGAVKVYSLKSNSWRRISDFPYSLGTRFDNGELVNGALHWVVSDTHSFDPRKSLVAAFDLGTEDYRLVPLPEFAAGDKFYYMKVRVLGGCLSLVCDYNKDRFDVWVMKEYGVQESWLILFKLTQFDVICKQIDGGGGRNGPFEIMIPIAYSDCGRKVLLRIDGCLMWYDLDEKYVDLTILRIAPHDKACFEVYTCLKSLVKLNNGGICDCDLEIKGV